MLHFFKIINKFITTLPLRDEYLVLEFHVECTLKYIVVSVCVVVFLLGLDLYLQIVFIYDEFVKLHLNTELSVNFSNKNKQSK